MSTTSKVASYEDIVKYVATNGKPRAIQMIKELISSADKEWAFKLFEMVKLTLNEVQVIYEDDYYAVIPYYFSINMDVL